jgi:membrane protease subunit HflK
VKSVSESVMREIVGKTDIATALAEGRAEIEAQSLVLIQSVLDEYESGVHVMQVELQKVDPPEAVIDAFRDVQRAKADEQRLINESEGYKRDILPRARGQAEKIIQEADGYRQEVLARAEGDANRFLAVYTEYKEAKDVTRKRIYLETMEGLFEGMNKVIIDSSAQSSQGVVPYLPLPELERARGQQENQ